MPRGDIFFGLKTDAWVFLAEITQMLEMWLTHGE